MSVLFKLIYRFKTIPIKIAAGFQNTWRKTGVRRAKITLEKIRVGGVLPPGAQTRSAAPAIEATWSYLVDTPAPRSVGWEGTSRTDLLGEGRLGSDKDTE